MQKNLLKAPAATRKPVTRTLHGITWTDDYAWLKAKNWQEVLHKPEALPQDIRAYLEAENAYTQAFLDPLQPLQDHLFEEMKGRVAEDDASVPTPDGPWEYFTKFVKGGEHKIICRRPRGGGPESELLNGNALAEGQTYFAFGDLAHSPCHNLLAYGTDTAGSEFYTIRVRDMVTGNDLPGSVPQTEGNIVWRADSKAFYYLKLDENHRPAGIFRHLLGTHAATDVCVFTEADKGLFMGLSSTCGGAWLALDVHDHTKSEVWLLSLREENPEPFVVAPRQADVLYGVEVHPRLGVVAKTNGSGAEDFMLVHAPLEACGPDFWQKTTPLVPHVAGNLVEDWVLLESWLVYEVWDNAMPRLRVLQLADALTGLSHLSAHDVAFTEPTYSVGLHSGYEFSRNTVRFTYSSFTTPEETWEYDLPTGERTLLKRREVPSGHNPADYASEWLEIEAPAGNGRAGVVKVPVSVVYKKGTPLNGTAPLWLNGYGAYGMSYPAGFDAKIFSLLDRGWIFARAHIRGGAERGRNWYLSGKLGNKINTFTDFIAAAETLVARGYGQKGKIVANGASAGGMLMGAVANMAPAGLFAGIVAGVPFVDALNTMLDIDLPLTPPEWPEWGNPAASEAEFRLIQGYSAYENVHAGPYPAIFIHCGVTDPRVTYWEPAKWIARLRERAPAGTYYLLTNMDSGHFGSGARFEYLREYARNYAFALNVLNSGEDAA